MFGRFNSLIVDLISLFFGFISLFGQVGICTLLFRNINHLWAQNGSRDRQRSRFSLYIPVDQGNATRSDIARAHAFDRIDPGLERVAQLGQAETLGYGTSDDGVSDHRAVG